MPKSRPWVEIKAQIMADPVRRARVEEGTNALRDGIALSQIRAQLGLADYDDPRDAEDPDIDSAIHDNYGNDSDDVYITTLRDYVRAIGGQLEINAVFPDGTLTLLPGRRWAASIPSK